MYDPRDEARRRAEEIYERLVREMRSDLERKLEIAAPPVAWSDFNPQRDAAEAAAVPLR